MANVSTDYQLTDSASEDNRAGEVRDYNPDPSAALHEPRLRALAYTIEAEIVPRLIMARRIAMERDKPEAATPLGDGIPHLISPDTVTSLVEALIAPDARLAEALFNQCRDQGFEPELLCLSLLAPAARQLGVLWVEDKVDIIQVTLGLCRLQTMLREISRDHDTPLMPKSAHHRILLAAPAAEQHTFGLEIVGEFFRRAGWDVVIQAAASDADLLAHVEREEFAVVGLTVAIDAAATGLAAHIAALRRRSRQKQLAVIIGGYRIVSCPDLANTLGADAAAVDALDAVRLGEAFVARLSQRNH